MSKELDQALAELVESARSAGTGVVEFVQTHGADVCAEIVRWKITAGCIGLSLVVASIIVTALLWRAAIRAQDKDSETVRFALAGLASISLVLISLASAMAITSGAQAIVAPKLTILNEIARIAK